MERIIKFEPAFDKRDPNPAKNYGIHGVNLRMVLKGEEGAVQFLLYTNWHLPSVDKSSWPSTLWEPMPADLGYHSKTPRYEGHTSFDCEYTDTGICYYDGSSLNAIRVFEVLVAEGDEGVWRELEEYYKETFDAAIRQGS